MIVEAGMVVRGAVEGEGDLVVRGRVEGGVRIGGALTVEPGGIVDGEVEARAVNVLPGGLFRGQVAIGDAERRALPRDDVHTPMHTELADERATMPSLPSRARDIPRLAVPARVPLRRR